MKGFRRKQEKSKKETDPGISDYHYSRIGCAQTLLYYYAAPFIAYGLGNIANSAEIPFVLGCSLNTVLMAVTGGLISSRKTAPMVIGYVSAALAGVSSPGLSPEAIGAMIAGFGVGHVLGSWLVGDNSEEDKYAKRQ